MSTAALVVELMSADGGRDQRWQQAAKIGRWLATPVIGLADTRGLTLATLARDGTSRELVDLPFDGPAVTSDIREQLGPRQIFEMKTGSRQPGLFPIDVSLLDYARQVSEDRLAPRVERALVAAFDHLGYEREQDAARDHVERSHKKASRLVVGAITALVLRDKEGFTGLTPGALLDTVMQRYTNDFSWVENLSSDELDALTGLLAGLGDDINFKSLDPLVLSGVYESTLVTDIARRQLGTHYTPPGLARKMLAELPVESIAPGDRSVLDPTCGSGGLLLAAHDRLRGLQPSDWNLDQSHRDLAEHLRGFDTDAFAVEIARLSLLLHAMPAGNGWDVRHSDALAAAIPTVERPSIIVANPPWRNTNAGSRIEAADQFLNWMLANLKPGGLLAIVLPVGWLRNRSSRDARDALRSGCDLFEIWRLPKGTFQSGNMAPAVLFAQKKSRGLKGGSGLLFRRVATRKELDGFYHSASESETYLASPDKLPSDGTLITGPITAAFSGRSGVRKLASAATVTAGPQPKPGLTPRIDGSNSLYLPKLRDMRPFAIIPQDVLMPVRFPEDFQTGRGAVGLGRRKIVIPAASGPDTPWRLWAGLDLEGALVRNSMHMVIPKRDGDRYLFGLAAFLSSSFASCWIDERAVERNVSTSDVLGIPVPVAAKCWSELAALGREAFLGQHTPQDLAGIGRRIDQLVLDELDLPDSVRLRIRDRLAEAVAPEGVPRYAPPSVATRQTVGRRRSRFGVVHAVANGRLLVEIVGVTSHEGQWTEPPPGLPAWLCQPGATFDVLIADGASLDEAQFFYQPETWVDSETVWRHPAYQG